MRKNTDRVAIVLGWRLRCKLKAASQDFVLHLLNHQRQSSHSGSGARLLYRGMWTCRGFFALIRRMSYRNIRAASLAMEVEVMAPQVTRYLLNSPEGHPLGTNQGRDLAPTTPQHMTTDQLLIGKMIFLISTKYNVSCQNTHARL